MTAWEPSFAAQRSRLLAIAYRMLGSVAAAEDMLQEAWLRVHETDPATVEVPAALLRTVVVRLCLDQLKSARQKRETYIGPWLPEPVRAEPPDGLSASATPDERVGELESLSMAFLLVLESLSPLERAAFLLHEVFDYSFDEIAASLGRSPAACRQLCHRAREHIARRRPRFASSKEQRMRLLQAFLAATSAGDVEGLSQLLCADAVVTTDGGGEVRAARKEVRGRDRAARLLVGIYRHGGNPPGATFEFDWVNGCPAMLSYVDGRLWLMLLIEDDGERITAVRTVMAPTKLRSLQAPKLP